MFEPGRAARAPYAADPARRFDAYSRKRWCARREVADIEHGARLPGAHLSVDYRQSCERDVPKTRGRTAATRAIGGQ